MTREEAIQEFQNVKDLVKQDGKDWFDERDLELIDMAIEALQTDATDVTVEYDVEYLPDKDGIHQAKATITKANVMQGWIPCSERLPSEDEIVNITWVNHNPPPYYADIAEKPYVASGLRYRDKWYWYSSVCQDLHQDFDLIDKDIEVIAWQPLPKPYRKDGEEE